ncbi:MAG: hypothetical protein KC441_15115 [Anaerolineales bacterium]|nr:hypothetical protein [Anaerolineales bacterium]
MSAKIKNDQLLAYLFDGKPHTLSGPMSRWIEASRGFKEFASEYRDKIRKKIRITQSDSAVQDLMAELDVAYQLVQQKRFRVIYEPYGSEKGRGPDFAVAFKSFTFNVEVTRIHSGSLERNEKSPGFERQQVNGRLVDTVCEKLGQMRPGMSNVLIIVSDSDFFAALDLDQAMTQMKDRVEQKEEGLYGRYGFVKPADFFKYYLRLSAILIRPLGSEETKVSPNLWLNNQAKHPLTSPLKNALQKLQQP